MEAVSGDQFKLGHLQKRIADITVKYEGQISEYALATAVLKQERNEAREVAQALQTEVENLKAQLAELTADEQAEDETADVVEPPSEENDG